MAAAPARPNPPGVFNIREPKTVGPRGPTYHLVVGRLTPYLPGRIQVINTNGNMRIDKEEVIAAEQGAWRTPITNAWLTNRPPLRDRRTLECPGPGPIPHGIVGPDMLVLVNLNDAVPPALGVTPNFHDLRLSIWRVLDRIMRQPAISGVNTPWRKQWNSVAFKLIGSRSGYGYDNAAEHILSAIHGWFNIPPEYAAGGPHDTNLPYVGGDRLPPAPNRRAVINDVWLCVKDRRGGDRKRAIDAWGAAWDRYILRVAPSNTSRRIRQAELEGLGGPNPPPLPPALFDNNTPAVPLTNGPVVNRQPWYPDRPIDERFIQDWCRVTRHATVYL